MLVTAGPWRLEIESGSAARFLCGTFTGAAGNRPADNPYIPMSGNGAACDNTSGSFTIYQIAFDKRGKITRLNMTFNQTCDVSSGPMVGLVRYNATTPTPVPDLPSSVKPITVPAHSGSTSANADELSVQSAPGDVIGGGRPADFTWGV